MEEKHIPKIIGKKGRNIDELERRIGIGIGIEPLESQKIESQEIMEDKVEIPVEISGNYVVLNFGKDAIGTSFDIIVEEEYLFTATVGKKGSIKIKKDIELADIIIKAIKRNIPVSARIRLDQ